MFKSLLEFFKANKKLSMALIGILATILHLVLNKFNVVIPETKLHELLAMIGAYILGQGVADMGKEKAKLETKKGQ